MLKYGTWEWRVYTIESITPPVKHYSEWRTMYKDAPELLTPPDESVVDPSTEFTWNKVASIDAENTWYVAKLTGFPGADPLYFPWANSGKAILPKPWYQILKSSGATTFTWTIAAVRGDPATPDGKGMTFEYMMKIKYPEPRTFYVQ
jgi:hypothetical protein